MRTMTGCINYRTQLKLGPEIRGAGGFLPRPTVLRCSFAACGAGRDGVISISSSGYCGSDEIESLRPPPRKVFEVEAGNPAATECGVPEVEAVMGLASTSMATCGMVAVEGGAMVEPPLPTFAADTTLAGAAGAVSAGLAAVGSPRGGWRRTKSASQHWVAAETRRRSAPGELRQRIFVKTSSVFVVLLGTRYFELLSGL